MPRGHRTPEQRAAHAAKMRAKWADNGWAETARAEHAAAHELRRKRMQMPGFREDVLRRVREGQPAPRIAREIGVSEYLVLREAFCIVQDTLRKGRP